MPIAEDEMVMRNDQWEDCPGCGGEQKQQLFTRSVYKYIEYHTCHHCGLTKIFLFLPGHNGEKMRLVEIGQLLEPTLYQELTRSLNILEQAVTQSRSRHWGVNIGKKDLDAIGRLEDSALFTIRLLRSFVVTKNGHG